MNSFVLRAGAVTYVFSVLTEENGQGGSFKKTVEAKDSPSAWVQVVKELKAAGILKYVTRLELV